MIIIIDNGHGADTPGKRSPDGRLREYSWAREIAKKVSFELNSKGYKTTLLVTEEKDISLSERVKRVNKICAKVGARNAILISIHVNAAGCGEWRQARGWSAYTTRGITRSDALATCLYESAQQILPKEINIRKELSDGDEDWEADFYIIKKSICPAVLTENLFMDNEEDVKYLLSPEGKQKMVDIHVNGIINYLNKL